MFINLLAEYSVPTVGCECHAVLCCQLDARLHHSIRQAPAAATGNYCWGTPLSKKRGAGGKLSIGRKWVLSDVRGACTERVSPPPTHTRAGSWQQRVCCFEGHRVWVPGALTRHKSLLGVQPGIGPVCNQQLLLDILLRPSKERKNDTPCPLHVPPPMFPSHTPPCAQQPPPAVQDVAVPVSNQQPLQEHTRQAAAQAR